MASAKQDFARLNVRTIEIMAEKKDTGTTLALGWGLMLLFLSSMAFLIWIYNKYEIMNAVRWVRWAELQPLRLFISPDKIMFTDRSGIPVTFKNFVDLVRSTPTLELTPPMIVMISAITMVYYKYFLTIIFCPRVPP